ncbi:hypothetical protein pb186bvf_001490 [Paramecium bursaria]
MSIRQEPEMDSLQLRKALDNINNRINALSRSIPVSDCVADLKNQLEQHMIVPKLDLHRLKGQVNQAKRVTATFGQDENKISKQPVSPQKVRSFSMNIKNNAQVGSSLNNHNQYQQFKVSTQYGEQSRMQDKLQQSFLYQKVSRQEQNTPIKHSTVQNTPVKNCLPHNSLGHTPIRQQTPQVRQPIQQFPTTIQPQLYQQQLIRYLIIISLEQFKIISLDDNKYGEIKYFDTYRFCFLIFMTINNIKNQLYDMFTINFIRCRCNCFDLSTSFIFDQQTLKFIKFKLYNLFMKSKIYTEVIIQNKLYI